jgi:hypothetical protein
MASLLTIRLGGSSPSSIPSSLRLVLCNGCKGSAGASKGSSRSMAVTLRRSHDQEAGRESAAHGECLGCRKSWRSGSTGEPREKSNEITAIPLLLKQLALRGCLVTIDAMGTRARDCGPDYRARGRLRPCASRDNQGNLYEEVLATFALAEKDGWTDMPEPSVRFVAQGSWATDWKYGTTGLSAIPLSWPTWTLNGSGRACRALAWYAPKRQIHQEVSQEARYAPPQLPVRENVRGKRSEAIGALKTVCIGCST